MGKLNLKYLNICTINIIMFSIIFINTYIFSSFFCFIADYYFPKTRIYPLHKQKIIKNYKQILPCVLINLCISYPIFDIANIYYNTIETNKLNPIINIFLWLCISDLIFYNVHRLLHTKQLYFIHSIHHEYRYTHGIGAIYAHPIEFVLNNIVALVLPIYFIGIPLYQGYLIMVFSTFYTVVISHGGFIKDQDHLIHHQKYKYNYGLFIMDNIFRTNYNIK